MKTKNLLLIVVLFALGFSYTSALNGQVTKTVEQKQIDSSQRNVMRDSLKITDLQITLILEIRDNYFKKANAMILNDSLDRPEQNSEISELRNETNESIKILLGPVVYEKYIELIRIRMRKRNAAGTALAGK